VATDPAILFVKPKSINPADKKTLQQAGVIVIEVADPQSVKLTRPHAELSGTEMLTIACDVIGNKMISDASVRDSFADAICAAIVAKHKSR